MTNVEKNIQDIIDKDVKIGELTDSSFETIPDFIEKSDKPLSAKMVFNITTRINEIKEGIFDSCFADHYYSSQILFRTLLEHHLTLMYVFYRLKNDKNDKIGEEYYINRRREEEIDYWESNIKILKIIRADEHIAESKKIIYEERFPYLAEISKTELVKSNLHFKVKEMIKYFLKDVDFENLDENSEIVELSNLQYIRDFVHLSSFIHGGPMAEKLIEKYKDENLRNKKLLEICRVAFTIANGAKDLCLLHLYTLTDNKKYLQKSDAIRKIYN